jgi:formamidopyrimidine-DNA glycosylase
VVGRTIRHVIVNAPKSSIVVSTSLAPQSFAVALVEKTVKSVTRRGKNILMQLTGDVTLWSHLKMTGHFFWINREAPITKHDLVIFEFNPLPSENDNMHLRFNDYRRFGRLRLFPNAELFKQPGLAKLGPEPLEMSADQFAQICLTRPRQIKMALMDQNFIAGIGNIYADESLYLARIHPRRVTTSISAKKLRELHGHIQYLLKRAIRLRGTSVDSYSGLNGKPGAFQKYLKAYGKEGEPCGHCGSAIVRMMIGQRSAHYCPRCQRVR